MASSEKMADTKGMSMKPKSTRSTGADRRGKHGQARASSKSTARPAAGPSGESVIEKLRGPRSLGYMLVFLGVALIIQFAHLMEHVVQTIQVFALGVPRPMAGGIVGTAADFPIVHLVYNFALFLALLWASAWAYGLGGFRRLDRVGMWCLLIAAGIQTYHTGEHIIQFAQEIAVGTQRPPGFIGLFQDNVVVHLTLNTIEWVLPFVAFWRFGGIEVMMDWVRRRGIHAPTAT